MWSMLPLCLSCTHYLMLIKLFFPLLAVVVSSPPQHSHKHTHTRTHTNTHTRYNGSHSCSYKSYPTLPLISLHFWFHSLCLTVYSQSNAETSLNRGGVLRHYISHIFNAVLSSLPRCLNNHSHLGSPSHSNQHEGCLGQRSTIWPNDSETQSSHVSVTTL